MSAPSFAARTMTEQQRLTPTDPMGTGNLLEEL
jgi:hypothetical protein